MAIKRMMRKTNMKMPRKERRLASAKGPSKKEGAASRMRILPSEKMERKVPKGIY